MSFNTPNSNDFSNPSISLPSLRGRGRGWGFVGIGFVGHLCFSLRTQTF